MVVLCTVSMWLIYVPAGYVLLSTLAVIFECVGYILFTILVEDEDIFIEIYNNESLQQLIEDTNNNSNINLSLGTPSDLNEKLNINTDTPTPFNENYNYNERLAKLEEENTMIKSDKRSLES